MKNNVVIKWSNYLTLTVKFEAKKYDHSKSVVLKLFDSKVPNFLQ